MQTKIENGQPDFEAIEMAETENKETLIRNIINPTEGLAVNDQATLHDINLPEPNIAPSLLLLPNLNVIVD